MNGFEALSVRVCVAKNPKLHFFGREKVHIVSAREISTFLCVEKAMCLKILDIASEREFLTFSDT